MAYEKFINPRNGVYYAFVESPISVLNISIPKGVKRSKKNIVVDVEGNEISSSQKTLKEFIMNNVDSKDKSKTIIPLSAKKFPFGRMKGVNEQDLAEWDAYLQGFGYTVDDWLTLDEYRAKLQDADYLIEEN